FPAFSVALEFAAALALRPALVVVADDVAGRWRAGGCSLGLALLLRRIRSVRRLHLVGHAGAVGALAELARAIHLRPASECLTDGAAQLIAHLRGSGAAAVAIGGGGGGGTSTPWRSSGCGGLAAIATASGSGGRRRAR